MSGPIFDLEDLISVKNALHHGHNHHHHHRDPLFSSELQVDRVPASTEPSHKKTWVEPQYWSKKPFRFLGSFVPRMAPLLCLSRMMKKWSGRLSWREMSRSMGIMTAMGVMISFSSPSFPPVIPKTGKFDSNLCRATAVSEIERMQNSLLNDAKSQPQFSILEKSRDTGWTKSL